MKNIIFIIVCLLVFGAVSDARMNVGFLTGGDYVVDPCEDMGASGTYEFWWNGEYDSDTDKACLDSGGSTADASDASAGVIGVGGVINGTYGALTDADSEHVRWSYVDSTIDAEGTIEFQITTPAAFNADEALVEIYRDADNLIYVYFVNADDKIYARHEGNNDGGDFVTGGVVTVATTHTIYYSWRSSGTEKHMIKIDSGSWVGLDGTDDLTPFSGDTVSISVGDDHTASFAGTDTWKIDDVKVRSGYEGD